MSDSVRLHRRQPTRLPRPWDSPGKNTGVGCHFLLQCMKGKSEREVAQSCPILSDPMDCSLSGSSIHGIFPGKSTGVGCHCLLLSEKVGLKLNIQKMKIMASGPITSWEIDGETVETVSDFIFLGSKITADGECSHEIKRRLLLGRKVMTNLDSILKSRDITLPTKVCLVKAMVFSMVTYGCESWTVKKAECQRIDAFALWCWRRLLRVPWTARKSKQSILKKINPEYS